MAKDSRQKETQREKHRGRETRRKRSERKGRSQRTKRQEGEKRDPEARKEKRKECVKEEGKGDEWQRKKKECAIFVISGSSPWRKDGENRPQTAKITSKGATRKEKQDNEMNKKGCRMERGSN